MVNIQLDSKFTITSDSRQWMININGRADTFHTTLEAALRSYLERKLKASTASNINTLLLRQKQLCAALNSSLAPLEIKVETQKSSLSQNNAQKPKSIAIKNLSQPCKTQGFGSKSKIGVEE